MTLQQLKYVATVESCGSFSKAAQKLYVSQPSISNLVHSLEAELGITIFIRSSTGISITDEGRELLRLGSKLLRDADYINEYFSSAESESKPTFYLSSQHYDFVAQAFNDFVKDTKENQYIFGINQTQTATIIEDVRKQNSNMGILFLSDINRKNMEKTLSDNNLEFHLIAKTKPHIFVSHSHPLAKKNLVTVDDLEEFPCIIYDQNYDSPDFFSEEMILPNFYPKKVIYISDLYISLGLMRDCKAYDIGTGIVSKRLGQEITSIPIDTYDIVELGWVGIKKKQLEPIEKKFIRYLKKQLSNSAAK